MKTAKEKIIDFMAYYSIPEDFIIEFGNELGISIDDFVEAKMAWAEYLVQLEQEFPKEERRQFIQDKLKAMLAFAINKQKRLLKEYEVQKSENKLYENRKAIVELMEKIEEYKKHWYSVGKGEVKDLKDIVTPSDYFLIKKDGIQTYFEKNFLFVI